MVNRLSSRKSVSGVLLAGVLTAAGCSKTATDSSSTVVSTASATSAAAPSMPAPAASRATPSASASASLPACKAGEVIAYKYDQASTPVCGHPCNKESDCGANQECGLQAARSLETTMGVAAAKANEIMLCSPKASPATCKEGEVFGWVSQVPERGFCSKKCSADSDCLKGQICVEGHTTKAGGDVVHKCIAKPVK